VPTQSVVGTNVITPVEVFNVYTPPVTDTVVAEQDEGVSPAAHSFTFDTENTPTPGVSFAKTFFDCVTLT
jgi:hypothetical protein